MMTAWTGPSASVMTVSAMAVCAKFGSLLGAWLARCVHAVLHARSAWVWRCPQRLGWALRDEWEGFRVPPDPCCGLEFAYSIFEWECQEHDVD
jgi:hypothetical protein